MWIVIGLLLWCSLIIGVFLSGGFARWLAAPFLGAKDGFQAGKSWAGGWVAKLYALSASEPTKLAARFPSTLVPAERIDRIVQLVEVEATIDGDTERSYRLLLKHAKTKALCLAPNGRKTPLVKKITNAAQQMLGNPTWRIPYQIKNVEARDFVNWGDEQWFKALWKRDG